MLSGETAAGVDPVGVVKMMSSIATETENYLKAYRPPWNWSSLLSNENPMVDAIGHAAMKLVSELTDIKAVIIHTQTGGTALYMSKARPLIPIVAFTPDAGAVRRLCLYWGVSSVHAPSISTRAELHVSASKWLLNHGIAKAGDKMLMIYGTNFKGEGASDAISIADVDC
jgi:pyruvate kinase